MDSLLKLLNDMFKWGLEKTGLFYSKYRGFVYSREDPEGYGRLKLSVPEIFGDMVLDYWAWPASNYSGNGYGCQVLPQTNDMVWVEFEKGNPRKPIWNYGYFSKGEKPENLKDFNNYWFRTPSGLTIELDDTNNTIKITNTEGKTLVLSESHFTMLDGSFGGLLKVEPSVEKLNNIEQDINNLKQQISTWVPVSNDGGLALKNILTSWSSSSLQITQRDDIENDNITHGS